MVLDRLKAKTRAVEQLAAGEMTLFEAAAWFMHWNQNPPGFPLVHNRAFPGESPEEKVCRQVLSWAQAHMRRTMPPSQAEEAICRLEAELADHIATHGRVILPGQ
jgi:hypothetical protein